MNKILAFIKKHKTGLMTIGGVGMYTFTFIDTVRATIKSVRSVDKRKKEKGVNKLTKKEIVKTCWKYYIPSAIGFACGTTFIVASDYIAAKEYSALVLAENAVRLSYNEYRNHIKKTQGKEVDNEAASVANENTKKQINSKDFKPTNNYIVSDDRSLIKEPITNQFFRGSTNDINKIINELNADALSNDGLISLDEYYSKLSKRTTFNSDGLCGKANNQSTGWNIVGNNLLSIWMDADITDDGKPYITYSFVREPKNIN